MKKYNFNYSYLAQKLVEIIKVNESGSISYSEAFLKRDLESILETSYDFSDDIPRYEYNNIVRIGIKKFIKNKNRNGDALRKSIREAEYEFSHKNFEKYILITSFSFQYFHELKGLRFGNTLVKFYKTVPSKYNPNKIKSLVQGYFSEAHPSNYTIVECYIRARSPLEAIDKAFESIDFIRGLWNFSNNLRVANQIRSGKIRPVNSIRLGPVHTLHLPNGKLVGENFWYEVDCQIESSGGSVKKEWARIKRDFIFLRKNINKVRVKKEIKEIIIRYVRALDTPDYEAAYLKLWSLLEVLTNSRNMNYDKTIARTLFFFKNDTHHKEILEHLRLLRNKMVHVGESRKEMDAVIFQLKSFVERVIIFIINSRDYFNSMDEIGYFLDLSTDQYVLRKEIKLRNRVMTLFKTKKT